MSRGRVLGVGAAVGVMSAALLLGTSISVTEAQRALSQYAETEFSVTVAPVLELEGSADGVEWNDSGTATELTFTPDRMALRVGAAEAVYAPMHVRVGAGSNTGATASVMETGLGGSDFAEALRGEVYLAAPSCDAAGVAEAENLTADTVLPGQSTAAFEVAAPEPIGASGAVTQLCVRVWLDNNNWLLGGTTPPTETATWTVTGTSV